MKASLSVALALAGACVAVRAAAQSVVVGPQASSIALMPGAQVTVPIVADLTGSGGASLGSIAASLLWRPSVLVYRGTSAGTLGAPVVNVDSAAGTLRFALANPAGATGQPVLLNAIFSVVGAAGTTDTLRVTLWELTGAGTFADLLPNGSTTPALLCVSTGLLGDLNQSATVTSLDALLILSNAVGLSIAPFAVTNGDVDGNAVVNTRDALVVLSYAVGLPVGSFRVGRMNPGSCAMQNPATVEIQPRTATVVTGDRIPLVATVKDSSGATVQGVGLVWTSANVTIAKPDSLGNLVAVGAGTTKVFASAAPGLKDSVTVTVSAARHVWYVNPAVAALNGGTELGSSAYPFSSIGQALARAAAADSVMVAPATYGEAVLITKPLTLVGDSTAAGVTTIRNPLGPGILVDGVASGLVRLDRLHIDDSRGGVIVRGAGTGVVDLRRIRVARSHDVGVAVRRVGQATLDSVTVQGAILRGVDLDSVPVVRLHAVAVDLVEQGGAGGQDVHGIAVHVVDSLSVDSVALTTAGFLMDTARVALFDRVTVTLGTTSGPALRADGGQRLSIRRSRIVGPDTTLLLVNSTAVVGLNQLEITGASGMFMDTTGGSFAARVLLADSVALDSLWIHDNGASAIAVDTARVILLRWSRIEDNHLVLPATNPAKAVRLAGFHRVRVTQSIVDFGAAAPASDGVYLQGISATLGPLGGARVQVDSSTFLGGRAVAVFGVSRVLHDTLSMFGLQAAPALTSRTRGVYAVNVGFLEAKGIEVDSSSWAGTGLYAYYIGGFDVRDSRFTHTGGAVGITADTLYVGSSPTNPGPGVFTGNTVECDSAVSWVGYVVNLSNVAPATVTNNVLRGRCIIGIVAANSAAGAPQGSAVMTDNVVGSVSSSNGPPFVAGGTMLSLQGAYKNALVARNTTTPGVILITDNSSLTGMDSLRIDSNTVRGNYRGGLVLYGKLRATTLRGNVVDSVPTTASLLGSGYGIYLGATTAGTTTRLIGNRVSRALKDGIYLPSPDTTLLDSNVVVDSRTAVVFTSSKVVGRWNFFARDSVGLSGATGSFVRISSSVIMQSIKGWGANNTGATPWEIQDNYWGAPLGPRCLSGCNPLSTGDSILGQATALSFTQFLASAPGNVPTGAPPALRAPVLAASRVGAPFLSAGATSTVTPAARAGRSRPRPLGRALSSTPVPDPLLLPRLPEVIW